MKQRVLFVVTTLGWGGAESQVIDLATRLQSRGWIVAVATLVKQAERGDALEAAGVEVHTLGMSRGIPDPRAFVRLVRLVRQFHPTIVHSHIVHANLLSRIVRAWCPFPVLVSSAHSINEEGRWREVAYRLTDRLTDLTTNVSDAAVERSVMVRSAPAHRIRCMPNGIDVGRFRPDSSLRVALRETLGVGERFVWLAVGRFDASKDYPILLRSLKKVADDPSRPLLLLVGEGPLRENMEASATDQALGGAARFLGRRDDLPALMNAADAYVMSSAWEGLPLVLLEAAATGLPIVATDVGGNAEVVRHGQTGELVPAGDAAALAGAMKRMMERSESARRELGDRGRKHVETVFGIESVVERWEAIYRELYETRFADPGRAQLAAT